MAFVAAALPYIAAAGAAVSVYQAATQKKPAAPAAPPPPPEPVTFQDPQVMQGGINARQRAIAAGGIMSNVATSPMGLTSPASTANKTLLGQ